MYGIKKKLIIKLLKKYPQASYKEIAVRADVHPSYVAKIAKQEGHERKNRRTRIPRPAKANMHAKEQGTNSMNSLSIKPEILRWAVDRSGAHLNALTEACNADTETVSGWMEGTATPTFKQAQTLAKLLHVPFGYLFLDSPPDTSLPLPDFRRNAINSDNPRMPLDLYDVTLDVLHKQDWWRDHQKANSVQPGVFVGMFSTSNTPKEIADDIRMRLNLDNLLHSQNDFLEELVVKAEEQGVLLMRNDIVGVTRNRPLKVDEFRGFAIADPVAPTVFVNSADIPTSQVFTLLHGLAHIWVGQDGICDADPHILDEGTNGTIEGFCNKVAAEVLVPVEHLKRRYKEWEQQPSEGHLDLFISDIAQEFRTSTVFAAKQLWAHKMIGHEELVEVSAQEGQRTLANPPERTDRKEYHQTVIDRNSRQLTEAILRSVNQPDGTLLRDAGKLLGVAPVKVAELQKTILGRNLAAANC